MTRAYPKVLGLTALAILSRLSICPATSAVLSRSVGTQTVPMHLPRLRERGLIRVTNQRRPFTYTLTTKGLLARKTEHGS